MAEVGLVLGSGLGPLADRLEGVETTPFTAAGLPSSGVPGHEGAFLRGTLAGHEVLVMRGRVHLYEGHDARTVAAGVRWMHREGVTTLVLTNAAGGLDPARPPGSWMLISDHLNLTGTSPLEGGARFVDLSEVYDREVRGQLRAAAAARGVELAEGVYAGLRGPQYETPAEVRMLRTLGADAVGMSTVLEAVEARALGMRVAGLSCLTNWAAGMEGATLDHDEVMQRGRQAADRMVGVLEEWLGGRR